MSNYQFLWCNAHIGAWKYYCDTPARFRVPLVMINTLLTMTENFWFPEIWLIVPRKEKIFLCPAVYKHIVTVIHLVWIQGGQSGGHRGQNWKKRAISARFCSILKKAVNPHPFWIRHCSQRVCNSITRMRQAYILFIDPGCRNLNKSY